LSDAVENDSTLKLVFTRNLHLEKQCHDQKQVGNYEDLEQKQDLIREPEGESFTIGNPEYEENLVEYDASCEQIDSSQINHNDDPSAISHVN
jgi:hypothetical protein